MSKSDFVRDNNPVSIYHVDKEIGTPDYVKTAAVITPESVDELSTVAFADPQNRLFPIHSKAATWLSAAYFYGNGAEEKGIGANLLKAAALHGIEEDVAKVADLFANAKSASAEAAVSDEDRFALVVDFKGNAGRQVERFYPIHDAGAILGSAESMMKDASAGRLPIEYLRAASVNLVKAASRFEISPDELHPRIVTLGTERLPDFDNALEIVETRKWASVGEEGLDCYRDIVNGARAEYEKAANVTERDAVLAKWVDLWLDLDATHNVKYSSTVLDPYQAFFQGEKVSEIEKLAKESIIIEGVILPKSEFTAVPAEAWQKHFPKAAAERLIGLQQIAGDSPEEVTSAFEKDFDVEGRREVLKVLLNA